MNVEEFKKLEKRFLVDKYPETTKELITIIESLIKNVEDFNLDDETKLNEYHKLHTDTIVKILIATSNYIYFKLQSSEQQRNEADMLYLQIRKKARLGLMTFNAEDMLYPVHDRKWFNWIFQTVTSPEFQKEAMNLLNERIVRDPITKRRLVMIATQPETKDGKLPKDD